MQLGDPVVLNGVGAAVSIDVNTLPVYKRTLDDETIGTVFIVHMKADKGTPIVKMKADSGEISGLPIPSTNQDWSALSLKSTETGEVLVAITEGDGVLQLTTKK